MSDLPDNDRLAETRHMTLILRLVLDPDGQIHHGEIIDADTKSMSRFKNWDEMIRALQDWLADQSAGHPRDEI